MPPAPSRLPNPLSAMSDRHFAHWPRHVSRHLSVPATSHTLARLRETLDELLGDDGITR